MSLVLLTDCNSNVIMQQGEFSFSQAEDDESQYDWFLDQDRWLEPDIDETEIMLERCIEEWMQ